MFEQTFKNIDDVLWKEAGCATELDYTEQTSWMLFLKYLDDLEHEQAMEAELTGKSHEFIIEKAFRWSSWAAPKDQNGQFDHNTALTGDDLILFINAKLFPYLRGFRQRAAGPAGFLCEAHDYLRYGSGGATGGNGNHLSTGDLEKLQTCTFYAKEKKSLPYVIGIMNMILHGIETPNIMHTNSLTENLSDIEEKDRFDIILANPPFGGKERKEVQQNFPIKTGETAFLFLQHFIKYLKAGRRAAVVIKNTFLSNSDNASRALRRELLESCNLHTVLDCPGGTFLGAGVKTVVLFFEKGAPTRNIWYYQLHPGRSLGKTNPLNDNDLKEFVALQANFAESDHSWTVDATDIDPDTMDLSVKNPNKADEKPLRDPEVIINEIQTLDKESEEILEVIRGMI